MSYKEKRCQLAETTIKPVKKLLNKIIISISTREHFGREERTDEEREEVKSVP